MAESNQQPAAVIPLHDPDGIVFPHLERVTPLLKALFGHVFIGVTAITQQRWPEHVAWLKNDDFFDGIYHAATMAVGEQFLALYRHAATAGHPDRLLHLCFPDRLAFALQGRHRASCMADIRLITAGASPLIFQRSPAAWATHPRNYYEIERMATTAGEHLFGRSLDFAWCHLVIQAGTLQPILPSIRRHDISMVGEIVLAIRDDVGTRDVDWLAWEDPFIHACPASRLKGDREQSPAETGKRLSYVIPILQLIHAAAGD